MTTGVSNRLPFSMDDSFETLASTPWKDGTLTLILDQL